MRKTCVSSWFLLVCLFQWSIAQGAGSKVAYSPASSGLYIGSPSICRLANGDYLASHDLFGPQSKEFESPVSCIYRSTDKGKSWTQISTINGQFWSKLFVHQGNLYFLGTSKHHGNTIIRKSLDNGQTWTSPTAVSYTHLDVYKRQVFFWVGIIYWPNSVRMIACWCCFWCNNWRKPTLLWQNVSP